MTKEYCGKRYGDQSAEVFIRDAGSIRPLSPRFDLRNHSPTGFEWGYGGSGPAQLALAILADHLGDDAKALRFYQRFKARVIAIIPQEKDWTLTPADVDWQLGVIAKEEQSHAG